MTDRVGQLLGNYQLIKLLGQGGCAEVYLGKHRYLNSYAALKVLNVTIQLGDEHRYLAEAQRLVDLQHPHIVRLLDFCLQNGTPTLIMDYAPKGSLRQHYPQGTRIPLAAVVDFVTQIAAALQYAHNHKVIHRDVKPENILLNTDNHLLLSDFGLALLTPSSQQLSTQDPAGTARYMAPEQLHGKPCFASDQYALAVMVYEWLCGNPPFRGTVWEVWHQHMYTPPPPLHPIDPIFPPRLEQVIRRALTKNPQDRFVSIQAFAWALAQASQISPPIAEHPSQVTAPMQPLPRSPLPVPPPHPDELSPRNNQSAQILLKVQAKVASQQQQNRIRLLQRVRSFWITGMLEQSLHGEALMTLGLREQPDAVANPWRLVIQESELVSTPLPAGTRITEVYDSAHGELLILGEPGAGKTTLLLELARDLLERAEQEQAHPLPVVFNLSSWTRRQQPLATWLIEELETKYLVPRKVGSEWINTDQILPLLDGLDEVDASSRTACMQAINEYHQAHSLVPLVVCCRMNEYRLQASRLALGRAVSIQPLTIEQINKYFAGIGEKTAALHTAFQKDPVLQELATTPLMLTILIIAYQGSSLEEIQGGVPADILQQQIFATYTQRMLQRRSGRSRYSPQQTIHWLSHLAWQMRQQSQISLYIERIQPDWLMKKWQRQLYASLTTGPICGLIVGLVFLYNLPMCLLSALVATLIVGFLFAWVSESPAETKTITHTRIRFRQSLATTLQNRVKVGVMAGLAVGTTNGLYGYLFDFPHASFGARIAPAFGYGILVGIYVGFSLGLAIRLEKRIEAMEGLSWSWTGIRRNIVKWFLIGISIGSIQGLIFALPSLTASRDVWVAQFVLFGSWAAIHFVLIITLINGVSRGLSKRVLDAQHIITPNQGTWRSARYGLVMAIIIGVIAMVFAGASDLMRGLWLPVAQNSVIDYAMVNMTGHIFGISPTTRQAYLILHALFIGPRNGAILSLAAGLYCGGRAYLQHFVLRFLLWRTKSVPFNYPHFLDYAAERILLRKIGGGYIFIHRLLLEYFASLWDQDTKTGTSHIHVGTGVSPHLQQPTGR